MRRNDFINNLIELSKKAYINKADAEDLDDIVYDIFGLVFLGGESTPFWIQILRLRQSFDVFLHIFPKI